MWLYFLVMLAEEYYLVLILLWILVCRHGTVMEIWFSSAGCAVSLLVPKHSLSVSKSHNMCMLLG
jgi:hypothetical protein